MEVKIGHLGQDIWPHYGGGPRRGPNSGKVGTKRGGVLFLAAAGGVGRQAKRGGGSYFWRRGGVGRQAKRPPWSKFRP